MRLALLTTLCLGTLSATARAQAPGAPMHPGGPDGAAADEQTWALELSLLQYHMAWDTDFLLPIFTADRGALHLEARYNYEDFDTFSLWTGYNYFAGDELALQLTPMVGATFGATDGLGLGLEFDLAWKEFELYSESQYVRDLENADDSYLYNWSELTLAPVDWLRFGYSGQRTRQIDPVLEYHPGLLLGFEFEHVGITTYVFDPGTEEPTWLLSIDIANR